jgi:hypothetical protein
MPGLKRAVDAMVYLSVVLGLFLLYAASSLVPTWLLGALATGEVAYAIAALGVAMHFRPAYYAVFVLAVLTLVASLPRPEHYAFATEGDWVQFLIFALGNALQVCLIVTVPLLIRRERRLLPS